MTQCDWWDGLRIPSYVPWCQMFRCQAVHAAIMYPIYQFVSCMMYSCLQEDQTLYLNIIADCWLKIEDNKKLLISFPHILVISLEGLKWSKIFVEMWTSNQVMMAPDNRPVMWDHAVALYQDPYHQ